jgi:hypothetical protein
MSILSGSKIFENRTLGTIVAGGGERQELESTSSIGKRD